MALLFKTFDELRASIDGWQQDATERCNIWNVKFHKDPLYALEWGESVFSAAAERHVAATALHFLDDAVKKGMSQQDFAREMLKFARDRQMEVVRQPPRSTSVQSNVVKQEVARAWYDLTDGGFSSVAYTLGKWAE